MKDNLYFHFPSAFVLFGVSCFAPNFYDDDNNNNNNNNNFYY